MTYCVVQGALFSILQYSKWEKNLKIKWICVCVCVYIYESRRCTPETKTLKINYSSIK